MNLFIVQHNDGEYVAKRSHNDGVGWTKNKDKARIFKRKSDITQCMECRDIPKEKYTILSLLKEEPKVKVNLECTPDGFIRHKPNYRIVKARPESSNLYPCWQEAIFDSREKATVYANHYCNEIAKIHTDYVIVQETYEDINGNFKIRPYWKDYLLGLAFVVSRRSHDIQTQHGCVIADKNNRILGTGYNGFPRRLKDASLPNTRPDKYPWMIHSEINALANCTVRPDGGTAYITGVPCNPCLMTMWQNGISYIICGSKYSWAKESEETKKIFDQFTEMSGISIEYASPNLNWIKDLADELPKLLGRDNVSSSKNLV